MNKEDLLKLNQEGEGAPRLLLSGVAGSRAHGTETPQSDVDQRSVFLQPTSVVLALRDPKAPGYKVYHKVPGTDDNAWELGHFLMLCQKGSPSTLEALLIEPTVASEEGLELRTLFPHLIGRKPVWGAFGGFARGEKQTFLSPHSGRTFKSMAHHLRCLYNGIELLRTGTFTVRIVDTPIGDMVLAAKRGELSAEEVVGKGEELEAELNAAYESSRLPDYPSIGKANEFLLRVRRDNW